VKQKCCCIDRTLSGHTGLAGNTHSAPYNEQEGIMDVASTSIDAPAITIRRLGPADATGLEAHYQRLTPYDALNLFSEQAESIAVKRYLAGIDFHRDIILAALGRDGAVRATVRIRVQRGSRWAELVPVREHDRVAPEQWKETIHAAVAAASSASIGWLSVASLGYDAETRDALKGVGFDLQAEEDGTIGELCLGHAGSKRFT
jgi:hypothetical protein